MSLTTYLRAGIKAALDGPADHGEADFALAFADDKRMLSGVGANQADLLFADERTLAASAVEDLDLAGGLQGPFGQAITFAKVKAILIEADEGNTNNVVVGGDAAAAFVGPFGAAAHTIAVPPGGAVMITAPIAGWPVTGGTGDILQVANSGGGSGVTYKITIIGTSA